MDQQFQVPVDDPNADTEWNDILRKHGIIPEKPPSPTPMIQEALREAQRLQHENRLEDKDLDELHELEDDEDADFLEKYRQQRMAELSTVQQASKFNSVYHLQKVDYAREVTTASAEAFVFVNLTSSQGSNVESRILNDLWREAAQRFGDIKFCQIRAEMCIEGYPERNCPTILVYKDGDIKKQVVTLRELNGVRTSLSDLLQVLIEVGAIQEKDFRVTKMKQEKEEQMEEAKRKKEDEKADQDDEWD